MRGRREARLPIGAVSGEPRLAPSVSGTHPVAHRRRRVLLVASDETVRRGMARMLAGRGLEVLFAGGSREVTALCDSCPDVEIDVLISDPTMPEETSFRLTKCLIEQHPGLRVVFMSGLMPTAATLSQPTLRPFPWCPSSAADPPRAKPIGASKVAEAMGALLVEPEHAEARDRMR